MHLVSDLIRVVGGKLLQGNEEGVFSSASIDTRTVQKDQVFFALRGPHFDAHQFLDQAITKGASVLVIEKNHSFSKGEFAVVEVEDPLTALRSWGAYVRKKSSVKVLAVLGSNGKTTTKQMLGSIMSQVGETLVTSGNLNNRIGVPLMLSRIEPKHQFAVLELGTSEPGEIEQLTTWCAPHVALITNVGKDHLREFKTMEGVIKENAAVFESLTPENIAIVNLEDPHLKSYATRLKSKVFTFSSSSSADVFVSDCVSMESASKLTLTVLGESFSVKLPVLGRFQIQNALAAAAAARAAGASLNQIQKGLESFTPPAMRMQILPHASGAILIHDAYNANPSSMRAALQALCDSYPNHQRIVVLGDMRDLGVLAEQEHRDLGTWLSTLSMSHVFLYGRDMRWADQKGFERFQKKKRLCQRLLPLLGPNTVVLFKASRSLRLEQLVHGLLK